MTSELIHPQFRRFLWGIKENRKNNNNEKNRKERPLSKADSPWAHRRVPFQGMAEGKKKGPTPLSKKVPGRKKDE